MLLSEHMRRYKNLSKEKFDEVSQVLLSSFKEGNIVSSASVNYLKDFLDTVKTSYFELKDEVKAKRFKTTPVGTPAFASGSSGSQAGMSSTPRDSESSFMATVPPIKINQLVKRPADFNGVTPHPRIWIEDFIEAVEDNGWSERSTLKYIKTFLIEDAASWFKLEVRPVLTDQSSWADFYRLFEENFLGVADRQRTRRMVNEAEQKEGESVSTFIPNIRRLLFLMDPDMSELEQVGRIAEKLRSAYQRIVAEREPQTVKQLRDICRRVEAGMDAERIRQLKTHPARTNVKANDKSNDKVNDKKGEWKELSQVKCYKCQRMGHFARDCASPSSDKHSSAVQKVTTRFENETSDDEDVFTKYVCE